MISLSNLLSILLAMTMELSLSACGPGEPSQPAAEEPAPPAQTQEMPEEPAGDAAANLTVTAGTESYRGFLLDNVLHAPEGDIHYHIHIPDSYDGSEPHALYLTLPGYESVTCSRAARSRWVSPRALRSAPMKLPIRSLFMVSPRPQCSPAAGKTQPTSGRIPGKHHPELTPPHISRRPPGFPGCGSPVSGSCPPAAGRPGGSARASPATSPCPGGWCPR